MEHLQHNYFLHAGTHGICYNVTLTDSNSSAVISTVTYKPLKSQGIWRLAHSKYYCWDVKVSYGMLIRALCQYNITEPSDYRLRLYTNHFEIYLGYYVATPLPADIHSPSDSLQIVILSYSRRSVIHGFSMTCNLTLVPDGGSGTY